MMDELIFKINKDESLYRRRLEKTGMRYFRELRLAEFMARHPIGPRDDHLICIKTSILEVDKRRLDNVQ